MFNKVKPAVVALLCMAGISFGQEPCTSDQHYRAMLEKYPQLENYEHQFEEQLRNSLKTTSAGDTTIYDIPIVVHVIHDYGAENVSDDNLFLAAAYWADVYMKRNADTSGVIAPFKPYIGNPRIRLHLATIDPNGKPTKGIDRVQSYLTSNGDDGAKFNPWPQNKYVNIWLISAFGAADAGAAAYAYFPGSAAFAPYYDGIIALYSYTNNSTKTIPHEMGHVLNLSHPWGNTNSPGVACGGSDNVDDTPPTKGHLPTGCTPAALYDTACAIGYMVHYTAAGGGDSLVNYPDTTNAQNIMDYTYCQEMFTKGQVYRMRTALLNTTAGRNNLSTPGNLAATGALAPRPDLRPIADYILNRETGVTGIITDSRGYFMTFNNVGSFQFRNASWNDTIASVAWAFSNGASTPASASMNIVNNKFSIPGWVTVSLTATSNAGSDTLVNTHAVYAADTTSAGGEGYMQQFDSVAGISNWPMFNYYNNQFQWQFFTGAGYGDNNCVRYHSFDTSDRRTGSAIGDHDDFFTPAFNITGGPDSLFLDFYTSGASTTHGIPGGTNLKNDSLEIDATINGGTRWTKIIGYHNTDLCNNGAKTTDFVPTTASQWVPRSVLIPTAYRTNNTFFRFRYWPGNTGDNLYLDNFSINQYTADVRDVISSAAGTFSVYPNPATNGCNLVFKTGNNGMVSYSIKDLTGKVIYETRKAFSTNGVQQEAIPRSVTPTAGLYFITVVIDGISTTQKLVVY